jgi:hypothetical protein
MLASSGVDSPKLVAGVLFMDHSQPEVPAVIGAYTVKLKV